MNKSENIGELADALAKAQGEIKHAVKDSSNQFFKSRYADLASVWEACRGPLSRHGISIVQIPTTADGQSVLSTIMMHKSGQFIGGNYPIKPIKDDSQGVGSAITYARRYALQAMVGICPDDDDGNAAVGNTVKPPVAKVASVTGEPAKKMPEWTEEQKKEAGAIRAELLQIDLASDKELMELRTRMKYDAPSDVIDALYALLNKWRDIRDQNNHEAASPAIKQG